MFIQTEATPDPARLRFLPGCTVLPAGVLDITDKADAAVSPLAEQLFAIPGVAGVSLGKDYVAVTRADADWQGLKPQILGVIMDHLLSGAPIMRSADTAEHEPTEAEDRVRAALRQVIDPELGYNIVDLGLVYDVTVSADGDVVVTMTTTTPGCPATNYLKAGAGEAASAVEGVDTVDVELTYEPRWTPEQMSPEAKAHFGIRDGGR
jgi:metal-sulfur cluster biosynthetic enzyme